MPRNGAGSTRGPASRRGRRDLTHFVMPRCDAADSPQPPSSSSWQVWQDALDLTQSSGSGEVHCYFHYTTQLGFRNITAPSKKAVEVFVLHSVTNQHVMRCHVFLCPLTLPMATALSIRRPLCSPVVRRPMRGGDKARSVVRVRASQLTKREHLQTFVSIANISDEECIA